MEMKGLKILGARILVKEERLEDKLESGIIVPGREKEQTNKGTVLMTGPGAMLEDGRVIPVGVKPGDTVIYSSFSGSPIKEKADDPDVYLILNERDILCVFEKGAQ